MTIYFNILFPLHENRIKFHTLINPLPRKIFEFTYNFFGSTTVLDKTEKNVNHVRLTKKIKGQAKFQVAVAGVSIKTDVN